MHFTFTLIVLLCLNEVSDVMAWQDVSAYASTLKECLHKSLFKERREVLHSQQAIMLNSPCVVAPQAQ
jgi:hypothetical protein